MFRIYTEDIRRENIEEILNSYFTGFTLYPARGCWKGSCEDSLIAEIANVPERAVLDAAEEIKRLNKQESVLVVEIPETRELLV